MWRRHWPWFSLLAGLILVALAVPLARFLDGRIVLLGPIDVVKVEALLGVSTVWCLAAGLIGLVVRAAPGRFTGLFVQGIVVPAIVLAAFAMSAIVGVLVLVGLGVDPRYELDTPGDSPEYIVSTLTLGETSLTLYRSNNGVVYDHVQLPLPLAESPTSFESSRRVETDGSGRLFLVYRQQDGDEARVALPVD